MRMMRVWLVVVGAAVAGACSGTALPRWDGNYACVAGETVRPTVYRAAVWAADRPAALALMTLHAERTCGLMEGSYRLGSLFTAEGTLIVSQKVER